MSNLQVKVEYLGHIRHILGNEREEEIEIEDDALIVDLLRKLSDKYGESFKKTIYEPSGTDVKSNFMATVNGYLLNQLNGLKTKLRQGDHIILMPVISGG